MKQRMNFSERGLSLDEACELINEGRTAPYTYRKNSRQLLIDAIDDFAWFAMYWRGVEREHADRHGWCEGSAHGHSQAYMDCAGDLATKAGLATVIKSASATDDLRKRFLKAQAKLAPAAAEQKEAA